MNILRHFIKKDKKSKNLNIASKPPAPIMHTLPIFPINPPTQPKGPDYHILPINPPSPKTSIPVNTFLRDDSISLTGTLGTPRPPPRINPYVPPYTTGLIGPRIPKKDYGRKKER